MRPELKAIERDKDGVATYECLQQMLLSLPIALVSDNFFIFIVSDETWDNWDRKIEKQQKYTHYFKCPSIENI